MQTQLVRALRLNENGTCCHNQAKSKYVDSSEASAIF